MPVAVAEARNLIQAGNRVAFFATSTGEVERMADVLQEYSVPYQLGLESQSGAQSPPSPNERIMPAPCRALISSKAASVAARCWWIRNWPFWVRRILFETSDLIARQPTKSQLAAFAADMADLKPGDFVVHATHGVGQFPRHSRRSRKATKRATSCCSSTPANRSSMFRLTRLDLVQKYRGAGEAKPHLDRLGGVTWEKTKSRVKAKMRDMADELLKLYAQRRMAKGLRLLAGQQLAARI